MADLKTMSEVKRALRKARGARLYSNGDLEIYLRETPKVEYKPRGDVPDVSTHIYVRGFLKLPHGFSTHWGEYFQGVNDIDHRPAMVVCFRDSAAPLLLGDIQGVQVFLQNNSDTVRAKGLDNHSVTFYYKGAGEVEFSYVSTSSQRELLDNIVTAPVSLRFSSRTVEEREADCDLVWEMAKEGK